MSQPETKRAINHTLVCLTRRLYTHNDRAADASLANKGGT